MKHALLLIDIQNDFLPGGALAVPEGDAIVPVANQLMDAADLVVATQDWHPANHASFASQHPDNRVGDVIELDGVQQYLWPDHCVQETRGAQLVDALDTARIDKVVYKGTDPAVDSYSGFFDNARLRATGLEAYLRDQGVAQLTIVGLATDYCVKFTALDARDLGFQVTVVADGVRGVEVNPGDSAHALEEMRKSGVFIQGIAHTGTGLASWKKI